MWPQISGILDFGFWGFWILDLGDFGFWILGISDFGFWILGILDFGDFGFWGFWILGILDFGPLCSKSLCEAPNAPNLGDFGFWILAILGILGILDFGDFGVWGFWILDFGFCDKFWILHKKKKTVHADPGRRIYTQCDLTPLNSWSWCFCCCVYSQCWCQGGKWLVDFMYGNHILHQKTHRFLHVQFDSIALP